MCGKKWKSRLSPLDKHTPIKKSPKELTQQQASPKEHAWKLWLFKTRSEPRLSYTRATVPVPRNVFLHFWSSNPFRATRRAVPSRFACCVNTSYVDSKCSHE